MSKQGKKKNKVMSLGEFLITPSDSTSTSAPTQPAQQYVRINWADEMEKLDDTVDSTPPADFVFDRSKLPTAAKATLAPDIDLEAVPKKPPFTLYLSNISFEADENKIRGFFRESKILNVRLPLDERGRFKGHGCVDFEDRDSLIAALQKNETTFFNRPIRINLEGGQKRQFQSHHQSGYSHQQSSELRSDEADWRRPQQPVEQEQQHQNKTFYQDRNRHQQGQQGGYQKRMGGQQYGHRQDQYQQGQQQQQRRPYSGYQNKPRTFENKDSIEHQHQQYQQQQQQQQQPPQQQQQQQPAQQHSESQQSGTSSTSTPTTSMTERPKLNLLPRTKQVEDSDTSASQKSASIFGSAKPVNTAAREKEIEERLKKEREEAEKIEKEKKLQQEQAATGDGDENEDKEKEPPAEIENQVDETHETKRIHKTSFTSEDSRHHKSHDNDFQVVGGGKPRYNKNDNNNNNIRNQNRPGSSYTSPTSSGTYSHGHHRRDQQHSQQQQYHKKSDGSYHDRQPHHQHQIQQQQQQQHSVEPSKPAENPWKSRQAADLFSNRNVDHQPSDSGSNEGTNRSSANRPARTEYHNDDHQRRSYPNKPHYQSNRPPSNRDNNNRDNKDRRNNFDRNNKPLNKNPRGERNFNNENPKTVRTRPEGGNTYAPTVEQNTNKNDNLGFNNKFSNLAIDVEDADEIYNDEEGDFEQEA